MMPISTAAIRRHYDRLSIFYRVFWGEHIHHGLWRNGESPHAAQLTLVRELATRAGIQRGAKVLDVGCGLGASAIWLAQQLDCSVTGITISPVQKWLAQERAKSVELQGRVRFQVGDANNLPFTAAEFDAVWVIECSEHLFDKQQFLYDCARVLRSSGVLAMCSWLQGEICSVDNRELISEICSGMLCPSLATFADYRSWIRESGFNLMHAEEISSRVMKTWQHCLQILERPIVRACLPFLGWRTRQFTGEFGTMERAYAIGALRYGMFAARKR